MTSYRVGEGVSDDEAKPISLSNVRGSGAHDGRADFLGIADGDADEALDVLLAQVLLQRCPRYSGAGVGFNDVES